MPEKPTTIALYAASAVFAAMGLAYIFGPSLFPDSSYKNRVPGAVGLSNPANDCFINSVLQALAGSDELREYLEEVGDLLASNQPAGEISVKAETVKEKFAVYTVPTHAPMTESLKVMLGILGERPRYRKTVSARNFISALEQIFGARLSRRQQDAQEFAQVVLEGLDDEHGALKKSFSAAASKPIEDEERIKEARPVPKFPLTGQLSSQIECQTCQYQPSSTLSSFLTLSLNVPRTSAFSSTSLDACFDGLLKVETIDGYKCARCAVAALLKQKRVPRAKAGEAENVTIEELEMLLDSPLDPAKEARLSEIADTTTSSKTPVPLSRIQKHVAISVLPPVLFIHLSRSIFDASFSSSKNMARVEFPELLVLGRIGEKRRKYLLSAIICHKGGHDSGHYETFRRQVAALPDPTDEDKNKSNDDADGYIMVEENAAGGHDMKKSAGTASARKKSKPVDKWWRISDDKVSECKTRDMLNMQKEVYILLYELKN